MKKDCLNKTDGQGNPINPTARYFIQDTHPGAIVGNLDDAEIYQGTHVLNMRETIPSPTHPSTATLMQARKSDGALTMPAF